MEDCFYFLQGSCARGSTCKYRHSEEAKNSRTMCPEWKINKCLNDNCAFLHTHHEIKERKEIECYWQTHGGCKKTDCPFNHSNNTATASVPAADAKTPQVDPQVKSIFNSSNVTNTSRSRSPVRRSAPVKLNNNVNASPSKTVATPSGSKELDFEIKSFEEIMREKRKKLDKEVAPSEDTLKKVVPPTVKINQENIKNGTVISSEISNNKLTASSVVATVERKSDDFDDIDKTIAELDELMNS